MEDSFTQSKKEYENALLNLERNEQLSDENKYILILCIF